jgi:hypothetical protein
VLEENRVYHHFSLLREDVERERKSKRREGLRRKLERES